MDVGEDFAIHFRLQGVVDGELAEDVGNPVQLGHERVGFRRDVGQVQPLVQEQAALSHFHDVRAVFCKSEEIGVVPPVVVPFRIEDHVLEIPVKLPFVFGEAFRTHVAGFAVVPGQGIHALAQFLGVFLGRREFLGEKVQKGCKRDNLVVDVFRRPLIDVFDDLFRALAAYNQSLDDFKKDRKDDCRFQDFDGEDFHFREDAEERETDEGDGGVEGREHVKSADEGDE